MFQDPSHVILVLINAGDQRTPRRACTFVQSRLGLRCSHTLSIEIDEDSEQAPLEHAHFNFTGCAISTVVAGGGPFVYWPI